MAEEEVVGATSPAPTDHKRKLEDLEPDAPEPPTTLNSNGSSDSAATDLNGAPSDDSDAKRPRLDPKSDSLVDAENGYEEEKTDEPKEEVTEQSAVVNNTETEDAEPKSEVAQETVNSEEPTTDDIPTEAAQQLSESENALGSAGEGEVQEPVEELQDKPADASQQGDDSSREEQPTSSDKLTSRKMEVPSNKVGVLIGKAGDTIRTLQNHSGARIQITRDSDADPNSTTRPVELIGSLENIIKAEKLIKDVIAEADAGGSPSLVARGFSSSQSSGATEQIQIQVPNEKVGLIIGKGGETIKNLQTRSGARIQLIPQHLPEGDQSKERTVRVTGDKKQIEMAREMIKEAMNQPVRSSSSGAYNQQQGFHPRGPVGAQWGPRGPHPGQPTGYDYQQRGPYASQNNQYPTPAYGNYPQPPRSDFGWEQKPPTTALVPPAQTGYDYYGGQGGHTATPSAQLSNPMHAHAPGPGMGPPPQAGYNYGQPQAPNYGQPAPYSQTAPPQGYGHGYSETKYENQGPAQHPYGHGSQPSNYPQGTHPAYAQQEQYGKPSSYNMSQQGPYAQPYAQPRASQPGDAPYQGPISATQPYGPNAAAQQPYPYASSGQLQQAYPQYGSAPSNDGYNQPASAPVYPQQGGQPVAVYAQTGGQPVAGYAQAGPTAGYGQYPASQPGFTEQAAAQNNAGYGYQGVQDPAYAAAAAAAGSAYGAPPTGQPAYSQPAPTQPGYDQSVPQSGGYANVPVAYGKSVSPQPGYPPQYDASQMYAGHR